MDDVQQGRDEQRFEEEGKKPGEGSHDGETETDTITCATQKNDVPAPAPPNAALNAEVVLRDQIRSEGTRKLRST